MLTALALVLPLVGVAIGAWLSPIANARQSRREASRQQFRDARAALQRAQAARHFPSDVPAGYLDPQDEAAQSVRDFNRRMREMSIATFTDAMTECRAKLATVQDTDTRIGALLSSKWELSEKDSPTLLAALSEGEARVLSWKASGHIKPTG